MQIEIKIDEHRWYFLRESHTGLYGRLISICGMGMLPYRRRVIFPARFFTLYFSEPEWRAALLYALQVVFQWLSAVLPAN